MRVDVVLLRIAAIALVAATLSRTASAETIARCGDGWLERDRGQLVLHVAGTPYAMGYQHGVLLREHCRKNLNAILKEKGPSLLKIGSVSVDPRPIIDGIVAGQREYVPPRYIQEMDGLAAGSGMPPADIYAGNFLPELFHCSGFAVKDSATSDGTLYHGRVLDYAVDWGLQEHAVLVVARPEGGIPFVNVTYAGFVGSVTGMNASQVAIGEMGGGGFGRWRGMPMALMVREVLQTADDFDAALDVFRNNRRTCQYYYVVSDGKTNRAVGLAATPDKLEVVEPGEAHRLLPHAVPDAVLLSAGGRYQKLVERVRSGHGRIDAEAARHLMDRPVAMGSNLHNVLFAPRSTRLWVAHASLDGRPAAEQPYTEFQLTELLERRPDPDARRLPPPPDRRAAAAASTTSSR